MEISNQVIQILDALCNKIGIAVDWTSDNVIPYLQILMQKYVNYTLTTNIIYIILISSLIAFFAYLTIYFYKKYSKSQSYSDDKEVYGGLAIGVGVILIMGIIIGVIIITTSAERIALCITFPEKLIMDYLKSFL